MMDFIRTRVKDSIFLKIFMGLLMLSFGIWGVGDFMNVGPLAPGVALQTGEAEVSVEDIRRRYNIEMTRFRESVGNQAAAEEGMKRAVMNSVVQSVTRAAIINAAARDLGVSVPRDHIRDEIMKMEAFQQSGKFSQLQFDEMLAQNDLTEASFVRLLESDLRQDALMGAVSINASAPKRLVDDLFKYRTETRVADTILIPSSSMELKAPPTDDELKAVYDQNVASFTAPEYRKLTTLMLVSTDLVKPDTITEEEMKTFYNENTARYRTPEARQIVQLVFESKEKAEAVRAQAAAGDDLEALASKTKAGSVVDLGELDAKAPLVKMIGEAYNLPANQISQPVETPLGWHLFEVKTIKPERVTPFEEARDAIRKTMADDRGVDAVYNASVQLEDAVASGMPLPQIAKNLGARLVEIEATDRDGHDPRGLEVSTPISRQEFLRTAFTTAEGKESQLLDLPERNGYYIVRVEKVMPPTPKPLIDVRGAVADLWEKQARVMQAQELGQKLASEIGPSTKMAELEQKNKSYSYAPLGPVTRFGEGLQRDTVVDGQRVSPEMLEKLFNAKEGEVISAPVANGVIVARLRNIVPAQPTGELASQQAELTTAIRSAIGNDLLTQVSKAFAARYPVEVNQKVIDDLVR